MVLGLTTVYLVAEVVGGLMTNSLALLADAGHMLTDVGGLGLALFAMSFAARPATPDRTYGFHRMEILAAFINSVVLVGISLFVADPIISAAIGLFILPRTFKLMGGAIGVLLEGTPADVNLAAVRARLEQLPGVDALHDLHVWTLTHL